jgi:hypothetical protein
LKLKRYKDAKKNLVEELSKAIASSEEKAIIRMAAALCYLSETILSREIGCYQRSPISMTITHIIYL